VFPVVYLIFYHILLIMMSWSDWKAIFTPAVSTPPQVICVAVLFFIVRFSPQFVTMPWRAIIKGVISKSDCVGEGLKCCWYNWNVTSAKWQATPCEIHYGVWVPIAVRLNANCFTLLSLLYIFCCSKWFKVSVDMEQESNGLGDCFTCRFDSWRGPAIDDRQIDGADDWCMHSRGSNHKPGWS